MKAKCEYVYQFFLGEKLTIDEDQCGFYCTDQIGLYLLGHIVNS